MDVSERRQNLASAKGDTGVTKISEIIREIETVDEAELREAFYELDGDGPEPGQAYQHQTMGLDRIERVGNFTPPVSGILHYPTGAGKTRVGMELIARALADNRRHRFVWATHAKNLIRQTMVRMAELSRLFPTGTRFTWSDADEAKEGEEDFHVVFMTRRALTTALDRVGDGRANHPWRRHLRSGDPLTLIYDECHQLGAEKLQRALRKFYVSGIPSAGRWRVIGLSATPVPTRVEAHRLLQEHVFPLRTEAPSTSHGWPLHVFQKVSNDALIKQDVLCPINLYLDKLGGFDLPQALLRKVMGEAHLSAPGAHLDAADVQRYALQFNSGVMADPAVVGFLAKRLGESIRLLGKTIVFVPNIAAANRMAGLLYEAFPALRGKVAAVHSKMRELHVPGQEDASVHEVLDRFRRLGDEPSILVNVDILTEGFDDPKVQSVVLARLTLSTNRFWQMIGRGTRGKRSKGTADCNVIDPVKLTRLYDYFAGYQPSFSREDDVEFEDLDERGGGQDAASPVVPQVTRPPEPATGVYALDPGLERVQAQVARAIRHFLQGHSLSEAQVVEIARAASVTITDGQAILGPSDGRFDPITATAMLLGEVSSLERRVGADLGWFRRQLPMDLTEPLLQQRMRMLRAIESLHLWTEGAFAEAQMSGDFLAAMQREAGSATQETTGAAIPEASARPLLDAAEAAVLDGLLAIAGAQGKVTAAEVAAIVESMRRMFGRASSPEVTEVVRTRPVPTALPFHEIEATLSAPQRQLLLWQMTEVAASDAVVSPAERTLIYSFAERLSVPQAFVESLLGANLARADFKPMLGPSTVCPSCGSDTPASGSFCTSCGTRLTERIT